MAGPSVSDAQIFKEALTSLTPDQLKSVAKDVVASASPEQRQALLHAIPADRIKPLLALIPDHVLAPAVAPKVPLSPPTVAPAEILQTTYTNNSFDTNSPDWAKNICGGSKISLTSPPKWEWMPVFANAQFEREGSLENPVAGLTGWVSLDGNLSLGDVPFVHPFGFDWEFFVVPDQQYESLLAPSNTGQSSNGTNTEYSDATTHAQDALGLQAPKGVLGVETDQDLVPEPFRLAVTDGARIAVFGRWIVDCGHEDFHSEIHPPLLMAVAKPTPAIGDIQVGSSEGTAVQIMSRPYLVSQQFAEGNFVSHLIAEVVKAEANVLGIPLSLRVEAHPTVLTTPYDGRTLIKLLVKPPVPKRSPLDRLAVSFHFTHRKGVAVQVFKAADDTVGVLIVLGDLNPAPLPAKHDHSVSVGDLHKIDPGDADIYAAVIGADVLLNPQAALVLARGILTDRYEAPSASSPLDNQNVASSVFVDNLNSAIGLSEDDTQPFPIYGWLNVGWQEDQVGAVSPGPLTTLRGTAVNQALSASGGTAPYTWAVLGLPAGLSATSAGQITGTPGTGAATSTVTATVTDINGVSSTITFTWTIVTTVPNVLSEQQSSAVNAINGAGLSVGRVSFINNCVDPGSVQTQNPSGGNTVPLGSQVDITVSTCAPGGGGGGGGGGRPPIRPK